MMRTALTLAMGAIIGLGGVSAARQNNQGGPKRNVLAAKDIVEKLAGKDAMVSFIEVTLEPGQSSAAHRHPGPVFGYVLEGEYEHAIDDQPSHVLKMGETFYEPTGCLHRVAKNPGQKDKTRILAVLLHPRDVKQISEPEPKK
jgi:quercetin dioxygenase-like cupin family protein